MAVGSEKGSAGSGTGWIFAATILVGAFLLFQVQPLISKFILPWFGGAPSVWTTCMLFFQMALFAGYLYSHLVAKRLTPRGQAIAQIVLLVAAIALLPIAPSASWKPVGSEAPTGRILLLLLATVGLPYFVLATTSPLVQAWFSRAFPGRSPYRLYALSNLGSLLALLSYPFVFEPAFDLRHQSWYWSGTFVVYAVLCGICAWSVWRVAGNAVGESVEGLALKEDAASSPAREGDPSWSRRLLWLLLPACASLVLLATTNHVCQDVAVVPFLWVVPLSLYLLTFMISFDHQRWYVPWAWAIAAALGILIVVGRTSLMGWLDDEHHIKITLSYTQELVLYFATMFFICMVCHGELVRVRPAPAHLTEFYLCISAGGALGGVAVSLIAPNIFTTFFEWKIGLTASYVIVAIVLIRSASLSTGAALAKWAVTGVMAVGLATIVQIQWNSDSQVLERIRNFYGIVSVSKIEAKNPDDDQFQLKHGLITHGRQYASPEKRNIPLTYYSYESGVGRAVEQLQKAKQSMRVGIVGLGVGTMAAYARAGDDYTFYEINPAVPLLTEKYFAYLGDARKRDAKVELVMGDARLSLERQLLENKPRKFDLLVLDAFSGDAIPAHLLTREAMRIYLPHMAPDGVIAIHITNSYLYLAPVVRGLADEVGLRWSRIYVIQDEKAHTFRSDWMLLTHDTRFTKAIPTIPPPEKANYHDDFSVPVWTDQSNSLFPILK